MHADAVFRGGMFRWMHYLDPPEHLLERFDAASQTASTDWASLEPDFAPA